MGRVCDSGVRVVSPSPTLDVGGCSQQNSKGEVPPADAGKDNSSLEPLPLAGVQGPRPSWTPKGPLPAPCGGP